MKELFNPVPYQPFNERYSVSNLGRVRVDFISPFSGNRAEFLKPGIGARGYPCVTFYYKGQKKQCFIHRMVAYVFLGNPPKGKNIVCHLDDNKLNNVADNLIWGNPYDNMRHMIEHKRSLAGSKNPRALLDDAKVLSIRKAYAQGGITQTELAEVFEIDQTVVSRVVLRKSWRHLP